MSESNENTRRRPASSRKVAIAQISPVLGDVEANVAKHVEAVERAKSEGVDLLVFPELSLTGYRLRDTVPEVATDKGGNLAARLASLSEGVSLVVGLVEEDQQHHFYNSAFFAESGSIQAAHRKVYLPTYGMFDEQRYFARGRRICAFNSKLGRASMLICEDMLHPTAAVVAALDGAHTIIVPSASPVKGIVGEGEVDQNGRHWEAYNRSMARTLGVYVVYANRVGVEDGIAFWGGSEVIGPGGDTLAKAAYYEEDFIIADVAEEEVRRRRLQSPTLRDEDLDLTINELLRLRQRPERRAERGDDRDSGRGTGQRGGEGRGYRRGDDQGRGGYRQRDDRGRGGYRQRDDQDRGGHRSRDEQDRGGYRQRDDRGRGGYRQRDDQDRGGHRSRDEQDRGGYRSRDDRSRGGYRKRDDDSRGGYRRRDDRDRDGQGSDRQGRGGSGESSGRDNRRRYGADRDERRSEARKVEHPRRNKPPSSKPAKRDRKRRPLDVAAIVDDDGESGE